MSAIDIEIKRWEDRVVYDVQFQDRTAKYITNLEEILRNSMEGFTMIATKSEALVYKIGRFFIEKGMKNEAICVLDGKLVEAYMELETNGKDPKWSVKSKIDQFVEIYKHQFEGKWLLIPNLGFTTTSTYAIYFMSSLSQYCIGVVWYAAETAPDNMTAVLVHGVDVFPNFYQFPEAIFHRSRRKKLPDDPY